MLKLSDARGNARQVELGPESMAKCVAKTSVGFMYAPRYHPVMRAVVPVRKSLGVRTAFNILGPMLNPAVPTLNPEPSLAPDASSGRKVGQLLQRARAAARVVGGARALEAADWETKRGPFFRPSMVPFDSL